MSDKIKIIYDVDDVLNNLNSYIFGKLGLPWGKRYLVTECTCYTKEQVDTLIKMYGDPEVFRNLTFVPGAKEIFDIERTGQAEVFIISRNFNQEVANVKMESLLKHIPNAKPDKIDMQIGSGNNKKIDESADIIVEDCIENCIRYPFDTIKILIDKPNNQAEAYGICEEEHNIFRVGSLIEANNLISAIVNHPESIGV